MNVYLEARPLEVLFRKVWVRDVFPLSVLVHKLIHILNSNVVHDPLKSVQKFGHCALSVTQWGPRERVDIKRSTHWEVNTWGKELHPVLTGSQLSDPDEAEWPKNSQTNPLIFRETSSSRKIIAYTWEKNVDMQPDYIRNISGLSAFNWKMKFKVN